MILLNGEPKSKGAGILPGKTMPPNNSVPTGPPEMTSGVEPMFRNSYIHKIRGDNDKMASEVPGPETEFQKNVTGVNAGADRLRNIYNPVLEAELERLNPGKVDVLRNESERMFTNTKRLSDFDDILNRRVDSLVNAQNHDYKAIPVERMRTLLNNIPGQNNEQINFDDYEKSANNDYLQGTVGRMRGEGDSDEGVPMYGPRSYALNRGRKVEYQRAPLAHFSTKDLKALANKSPKSDSIYRANAYFNPSAYQQPYGKKYDVEE